MKIGNLFTDRKNPIVAFQISQPTYQVGDVHYVSPQSQFSLSSEDKESGVKQITYSIDGKDESVLQESFAI